MLNALRSAPEDAQTVFMFFLGCLFVGWCVSTNFGLIAHYVVLVLYFIGSVFYFYAGIKQLNEIDLIFLIKYLLVVCPSLYYFIPKVLLKRRQAKMEG